MNLQTTKFFRICNRSLAITLINSMFIMLPRRTPLLTDVKLVGTRGYKRNPYTIIIQCLACTIITTVFIAVSKPDARYKTFLSVANTD